MQKLPSMRQRTSQCLGEYFPTFHKRSYYLHAYALMSHVNNDFIVHWVGSVGSLVVGLCCLHFSHLQHWEPRNTAAEDSRCQLQSLS